ncbi:ACT domain-containing protein [Artemisia annua]|uniref:ACT domain-containing protein n=1 Tax=Artemisia annua TaxID=35608 RepID=A0A2U1PV69_ARTAN|nr:ACT domain-containing protein [Artemisia annua]
MVVSPSDLKRLAKTRGASLRSLEIRGCQMVSEDGLLYIARYCKDLTSLRLDCNDIDDEAKANGKWLHKLALHNTVMESLDFHCPFVRYDMKDVTRFAKKCSNSLVSLEKSLSMLRSCIILAPGLWIEVGTIVVFNSRQIFVVYAFRISFPYLNQLRELDLYCGDLKPKCQCYFFKWCPSLEFCKNLRKLTHYGRVTHSGLKAVAQGCPDLDYLEVYPFKISNKALACVGTHLTKLRDFRILLRRTDSPPDMLVGRCKLDSGVRAMLMGCSKLERLDISLCLGGLTDMGLGYIGEYGHNLRHVSLSYTGESDVGLLELSKGCPKLRKLKLNDCPFSEQAIATFVFNNNHNLRYIRIDHGPDNVLVLTRPMVSAEKLSIFTKPQRRFKLSTPSVEKFFLSKVYGDVIHFDVMTYDLRCRLAVQLVADGSDAGSVKITYTSSRATTDIDTPLVRSMVASSIWKEERDTLGESSEKPLEIIVRIANVKSRFTTAVSEFGEIKLQGRVKDGVPHLKKVGAFEVDVSLDGHILLCRQVDEPNTISSVTSILGEENVNISSMSVDRAAPRKQAVMVIAVDEKPSKEALKKIDEIPAVKEFVFLAL